MHILQLCPRVPYPPHDGGAIAMYETARGLAAAGHRVTVLAANTPKHHQPADVLAHLGPRVQLVAVDVDTRIRPLRALRNLVFSRDCYIVERFISPALLAKLLAFARTEAVDVVQFEGTFVAWYAGPLAAALAAQGPAAGPRPRLVLRAHNVEFTIWEMLASRAVNPLKKWYLHSLARRLKAFETGMLRNVDALAAITAEDAARLQRLAQSGPPPRPGAAGPRGDAAAVVAVVPASFDFSGCAPGPGAPQPRTVFVIGSLNWLPNLEGLDWFLREVWPQAHAELPGLALHIAGLRPPAYLARRPAGQDNVFVHGFVESAAAFMQQYELMLVPLLSGGGMRVKVIEGLALGKPLLSTTLGAEGVAVHDGQSILLRDGAAAWLQALRDYYHGRLPLAALGQAAARTARAEYDTARATQLLVSLYHRLGPAPHPAADERVPRRPSPAATSC